MSPKLFPNLGMIWPFPSRVTLNALGACALGDWRRITVEREWLDGLEEANFIDPFERGRALPEQIAAIVFGLDGVLVDSESVWDAARREVVARSGGRWQANATRAMMGMSSAEWSRYLHDQLGVPLKPESQ